MSSPSATILRKRAEDSLMDDLSRLPQIEAAALRQQGVLFQDFLAAFDSAEDVRIAIGAAAAHVWSTHQSIRGPSQEDVAAAAKLLTESHLARGKSSDQIFLLGRKRAPTLFMEPTTSKRHLHIKAQGHSLSQMSASSSQPIESEVGDRLYSIYLAAGAYGTKWMDVCQQAEARRRAIIMTPLLRRFEERHLKTQLAFFVRWQRFATESSHFCPSPADAAFFLEAESHKGATVSLTLYNHMVWWRRHIGLAFPVKHDAVAALAVAHPGYAPCQRKPIELEAMWRLIQVSVQGVGTVHLLMRACVLMAASVIRYKHASISKRLKCGSRLILMECRRGKRVQAGQRPPFQWALPRSVLPDTDMVGPLLSLYLELESKLGDEVDFIVPDVDANLQAGLRNNAAWLATAMPYTRWVLVLRAIAQYLALPVELAPQLWTTYTFRRLLPTIADILGLHEGHRQALGEWTEQVSTASASVARAQPLMCHRYADDKVTTAGETKLLVASAISFAKGRNAGLQTWEEFRLMRPSLNELDKYASTFSWGDLPASVPSRDEDGPDVLLPSTSLDQQSDSSQISASSDEESLAEAGCPSVVEWFVQPGSTSRVHVQQARTQDGLRMPYCRKSVPFSNPPVETGAGTTSMALQTGGVCDHCLARAPAALAQQILNAVCNKNVDMTEPSTIEDQITGDSDDEILRSPWKWWHHET